MSLENLHRLHELTGLGHRTLQGRLKPLTPVKDGRALLYETKDALPLLYGLGDAARLDPQAERARLDCARADLAELDLARRRGELLPTAEVSAAWAGQVAIAKGRLLAMPARIAPGMIRCRDLRSAERLLRDALYTVLTELANDAASYGLPEGEPLPTPDAQAPAPG